MKFQTFLHAEFESLGAIETWLKKRRFQYGVTKFYKGDPSPQLGTVDALIFMGGPMGVYETDEHPWINTEIQILEKAIRSGKKIFGVCLGAQLLASALGARVYRAPIPEIGWFTVEPKEPLIAALSKPVQVFQWHYDTFDIPQGAKHIASSPTCENQAFLWHERALGVQFHMEFGMPEIEEAILESKKDHGRNSTIQIEEKIRARMSELPHMHENLHLLLDQFFLQ